MEEKQTSKDNFVMVRRFHSECKCCFECWWSDDEKDLCFVCADHPEWLTSFAYRTYRLNKIIQSIHTISMHRLPEIIKLMWEELSSRSKDGSRYWGE